MNNQQEAEDSVIQIANKIAEENFGGMRYAQIESVLNYLLKVVKDNSEFTSEKTAKLVQALHELEAFRVRA